MNNTTWTSMCFFLCLFLLASCGPSTVGKLEQAKNAAPLKAQEIITLVEGNTLWVESFADNGHLYFDGASSRVYGRDIDHNTDHGMWDVSVEDELCFKMKKWWYGELRCFSVHKDNQGYFLANADGVLQLKATMSSGDSQHLFHEVKDKTAKSARRSARGESSEESLKAAPSSRSARSAAPEKETEQPPTPAAPQAIVEEEKGQADASSRELRSTVKWMARDCPGCNLAQADLRKADLVAANLQGSKLQGADLHRANLRRADLRGANLEGADLSQANMPGANLQNADLRGADLTGANLIRADLSGAKLDGATMDGALTEGTTGLP